MTPNKRDLKAYVRFDGTGRIVPGSLVLRRTKPKNGNWKEIQTYECCDGGGTLTFITSLQENLFTSEFNGTVISFICTDVLPGFNANSGTSIGYEPPIVPFSFSNWDDVVNFLNTNYSAVGTFSYLGGTDIQIVVNSNINQYINCSNPQFLIEFFTP